ncbi:MAG TPA: NAD(P)H-dependent oxidoreductase [Usitatibacter sp.]|nr:NAD(P)H-dependent oxidoreductase [Usitatibacter sp.]
MGRVAMIVVVHAHPYPSTSRAGAALLEGIRGIPGLEIRSLCDLYPDFDIDVAAEQAALERATRVAFMHPLYWYTVPAILKHWMDTVLVPGWAHGPGGTRLAGKECLWIATASDEEAYGESPIPLVERVAVACGMKWLEPFVVRDTHQLSGEALRQAGRELRARLEPRD